MNLGNQDENYESKPPDQQALEAKNCFFPASLPPVKNAFITEAETVNAGTKFIIGDIAQQQVGEHIEKWFV